jgi:hypothetical protein
VCLVWGAEYLTIEKREKRKGKRRVSIRNKVLALRICFSYWYWSAIERDELARSIPPGGFKRGQYNIISIVEFIRAN